MRLAATMALLGLAALAGCVAMDPGPIDPGPQMCTQEYAPVCARRGDDRRTFPNECQADRAGYYVIRDGQCRGDRPDFPDPRPPRPERPQACPMIYAPVCAERGNDRQTFENACQADARGYRVVRQGECRGGGQMRPPGGSGTTEGRPGSSAPGGVPGAAGPSQPPVTNERPGVRPPAGACTREYAPVCGMVGGQRLTFGNECSAREAGARRIRPGEC